MGGVSLPLIVFFAGVAAVEGRKGEHIYINIHSSEGGSSSSRECNWQCQVSLPALRAACGNPKKKFCGLFLFLVKGRGGNWTNFDPSPKLPPLMLQRCYTALTWHKYLPSAIFLTDLLAHTHTQSGKYFFPQTKGFYFQKSTPHFVIIKPCRDHSVLLPICMVPFSHKEIRIFFVIYLGIYGGISLDCLGRSPHSSRQGGRTTNPPR